MNFEKSIFQQEVKDSDMQKNQLIDSLLETADRLEDEGEVLAAGKKIMKAANLAKAFQYKDKLYNRAYELFDLDDNAEREREECIKKMQNLKR